MFMSIPNIFSQPDLIPRSHVPSNHRSKREKLLPFVYACEKELEPVNKRTLQAGIILREPFVSTKNKTKATGQFQLIRRPAILGLRSGRFAKPRSLFNSNLIGPRLISRRVDRSTWQIGKLLCFQNKNPSFVKPSWNRVYFYYDAFYQRFWH